MDRESELQLWKTLSSEALCRMLATKVRQGRLRSKASQAAFASRAGIPLRTYKRFEAHGRANLETFMQVLMTMERTSYLALLFAEAPADGGMVIEQDEVIRSASQKDLLLKKVEELKQRARKREASG